LTISSPRAPAVAHAGVTMDNYNRLQTGMSYAQVVAILGEQGVELSSNEFGGYRNVMYKWDGYGGIGANMNAMFQNDHLISKAQMGLK
jgi:hypothetical protein